VARTKVHEEIRILHSFVVEKNPCMNPHDPNAAAAAYVKQLFGDRLISVGKAEFEDGPHGKVVLATYEYWDGEEEVPTGAAQTFKAAEGA